MSRPQHVAREPNGKAGRGIEAARWSERHSSTEPSVPEPTARLYSATASVAACQPSTARGVAGCALARASAAATGTAPSASRPSSRTWLRTLPPRPARPSRS